MTLTSVLLATTIVAKAMRVLIQYLVMIVSVQKDILEREMSAFLHAVMDVRTEAPAHHPINVIVLRGSKGSIVKRILTNARMARMA
jgi:hypothetical protein